MCMSVIVFITTNRPMLVDPESGGFTFAVQIRLMIVAESQLTERLERVHSIYVFFVRHIFENEYFYRYV